MLKPIALLLLAVPAAAFAGQNVVTQTCEDVRDVAEIVMQVRQQYEAVEADAAEGMGDAAQMFRNAMAFARYTDPSAQAAVVAEFGELYYRACKNTY